ncbi:hypothetical protein [Cyanobacterium sp. Dongsha4]|uniref:hypothetical protein n=1 Tax=Cyanobacterium sp. DS4 TaxID=2878255 RepID=UPI002E7FEA36|nr:hypothetical protein [Cyanobacterium sp. Dongsha4]WVL02074.1 hypothetical protein Dongsha4_07760 [Cyanobacterium sp. Dongsha4]
MTNKMLKRQIKCYSTYLLSPISQQLYYTGNQAGVFKIRVDHLYDTPSIELQICAY